MHVNRGSAGELDARFMRRALALARRGQGRVEPNPMVGCVLVRGGRVLGEGYHARFGGAHAEVEALRGCGGAARGATAYVTLEPCCYFGKTPPCVDALLSAGVARVVAAMKDPNPRVSGRGVAKLRARGVEVEVGLLGEEAEELNAPFRKLMRVGRPWVIAKWAQSLDGKLATVGGEARWITGVAARRHVHATRARVDAIVVGVGTILADDPSLTCRLARARRRARRVVLDGELRTPITARVVSGGAPTVIFCGRRAAARRMRRLERCGCEVRRVSRVGGGLDLDEILDVLGGEQLSNVVVEGGGRVLGSFLDARLVDEVHVYVAPLLIGGGQAPGPWQGRGAERLAEAIRLRSPQVRRMGRDWLWTQRL